MTRRRVGFLLAVAMTAAACGPGTTYSATFPGEHEDGTVALSAQPIDVIDLSGLVSGVSPAEVDGSAFGPLPAAEIGGSTVRLQWVGGACESRTRVVFSSKGSAYAIRVMPETSLLGMLGCPAVGIPRAVDIALRSSIQGRQLTTSIDR